MKRKPITVLLILTLVCLFLFALAGCNGTADEPETEPSQQPSSAPTPEGPQKLGADEAIENVIAIGFVDLDGAKLKAVAVQYSVDLSGAKVSPDDFAIEVNSVNGAANNGAGEIGDITAIYVNDEPAVSETGGSGSGSYVIIEVYTDYLAGTEQSFTNSLACGVQQTGTLTAENAVVSPGTELLVNYEGSAGNGGGGNGGGGMGGGMMGGGGRRTLKEGGFIIPDIANFQWFTDHPGSYGADGPSFVAYDCFDEKSGESVECHVGYALCLPEDWHKDGSYAMVVLDNPATGETTHPMASTLETRSPAVYASEWAQNLVKEKHGLDGLIVVVPVVTARVDDNACSPAEYEALVQLWDYLQETYSVDPDYVYGSGQSVGGMVLLETNRNRDNYFAGLMLYEDQWAQNYYKDTLFVRNQASEEKTAATAPMHYPRVKEYLTWDYYLDTNGDPVYEGHDPNNYYYLVSDDNILIMNRTGNNLSNDTWRELAYLYEDLVGAVVEQHVVDSKLSIAERDADVAAYLAAEADTGIRWVSFQNGSNGYTCRQIMAGYEWLLSQSRQTEISREKLDINKPFAIAATQIQNEDRATHFKDADGNTVYLLTARAGAGTQFYNTCWLNLTDVADAAPGWLPEGMSWTTGVSGVSVRGATAITDGSGKLVAVAVEYDKDMKGLVINVKGDDIIGLDGTVRSDIKIILDPYEFYDGDTLIDCEITNVYVNSTPAVKANAERDSGSGNYVIVELNTSSTASEIGVKQVTTVRTNTLIASPSYKLH